MSFLLYIVFSNYLVTT